MRAYNFLIWEDAGKLPFPDEVRPLINDFKWEDFYWSSEGFPIDGATYSLLKWKTLYQEFDPSGKSVIQKQDDFNGDVYFSGYFVNPDKENGQNYLVDFKATFLKGELMEVVLDRSLNHSTKEYLNEVEKNNLDFAKRIKRETSWWYKYIYKWYSLAVRTIAYCIIYCLLKLKDVITKVALFLTPL